MFRLFLFLFLISTCLNSYVHAGLFSTDGKFGKNKWTLNIKGNNFDLNKVAVSNDGLIVLTGFAGFDVERKLYFINSLSGAISNDKAVPEGLTPLLVKSEYTIFLSRDKSSIYSYNHKNRWLDHLDSPSTEEHGLSPWYLNVASHQNTISNRRNGFLNIQRTSKTGFNSLKNIGIRGLNHILEYELIDNDHVVVAYTKNRSVGSKSFTSYLSLYDTSNHDLQPSSVKQLWKLAIDFDPYSRNMSPDNQFDVYDDYIFVYDDLNNTHKININSGKVEWSIKPDTNVFYTEHTLIDETILIFAGAGMTDDLAELKAFHAENGKMKWSYVINEKDQRILGIKNYNGYAILAIQSENDKVVQLLSINVDKGTLIDKRLVKISTQLRKSDFEIVDDILLIQTASDEITAIELH